MRPPHAHLHDLRAGALLLVLLAGCATAGGTHPRRSDRSTLTRDELTEQHAENAYDAIVALRSNWLQERGPDSFINPSRVMVYLDDMWLGTAESLKMLSLRTVVSIRHLDGLEATARYGVGHGAGAIVVGTYPFGVAVR